MTIKLLLALPLLLGLSNTASAQTFSGGGGAAQPSPAITNGPTANLPDRKDDFPTALTCTTKMYSAGITLKRPLPKVDPKMVNGHWQVSYESKNTSNNMGLTRVKTKPRTRCKDIEFTGCQLQNDRDFVPVDNVVVFKTLAAYPTGGGICEVRIRASVQER